MKAAPREVALSTKDESRPRRPDSEVEGPGSAELDVANHDDPVVVLDADETANDPDDLHQLVVDHGDAVYRLAFSIVRDRTLAEDIAQEALVKAWLALPTLRSRDALRSWIMRITHNTSISMVRTRKAIATDPHEFPEPDAVPSKLVEARVEHGAAMEEFESALEDLDELSRSIVVLREIEGYSYGEIAEMLSVPLPTVKTRLLRARRRLSANLREWA